MFVKKDLRKVDEILSDQDDPRKILKLSKRSNEFEGSIRIITWEQKLTSMQNLTILNLYGNKINNLNGIGSLAFCPLKEINLGYNDLTSLPNEMSLLANTLNILWLDDNEFQTFPTIVSQLHELQELRISNNCISYIPPVISQLTKLETLALDNNEIQEFPEGILKIPTLRHLWLRQNELPDIPEDINIASSLRTLSLSSNKLLKVPDSISLLEELKFLYLNGNQMTEVS